jgi:hypothetical protein
MNRNGYDSSPTQDPKPLKAIRERIKGDRLDTFPSMLQHVEEYGIAIDPASCFSHV